MPTGTVRINDSNDHAQQYSAGVPAVQRQRDPRHRAGRHRQTGVEGQFDRLSALGATIYQGPWNASTNSPALVSGVGNKGFVYSVTTAGTTSLDGISTWNVGDGQRIAGAV